MKKSIHRLHTNLSMTECMSRLREQVQPISFWNRNLFFAKRTSRVVGRISGKEFMLEARDDWYSKRMEGRLIEQPSGTVIEFEWKKPFLSRLFGFYKFDEAEILSFFRDWLDAKPVSQ